MVLLKNTVLVFCAPMTTFQHSLSAWLSNEGNTQAALAAAVGKSQVTICRYVAGTRFPDAATAKAIDKHTAGNVPFSLWEADFLKRSGILVAADDQSEEA